MNLLTKISIVVLLVVAVFASIVFIQQAIVPANYMRAWNQEKAKSAMLEQNSRYTALALARAEKEIGEIRAAFAQDSAAKQKEITDRIGQLKDKDVLIAKSARDVEAYKASTVALQATIDGKEKANQTLLTQLEALRETLKATEERLRQTAEDLKQNQANYDRSERVNKALREQIAQLDTKIKELTEKMQVAQAGKGGEGVEEPAKLPGVANGQIIAVNNNMASINIGSAHGVSVGQKLIIYRDDKFIGYLRVEEVFPSESAGIVVDQQFEPLRGDKVTSSLK